MPRRTSGSSYLLADYANGAWLPQLKRGVFAWLNKPLKTELALQTLNSALALRSEKGKKP